MFSFRPTYEPLIKFCKELIAEKKALMEENEELKETLRCLRQDNQELRDKLFSKQKDERLDTLEKRVADLEQGKKIFLLDDNSTPIKSFTLTGKLTVMDEPAEEKLEVGKWYHTTDFTKEELEELLPVGTKVEVEDEVHYDDMETKPPEHTVISEVKGIVQGNVERRLLIDIDNWFNREWFKIIEEN